MTRIGDAAVSDAVGAPYLVEVADRVFAYVQPDGGWFVNNTGFLAGGSGSVAVDSCATERRTRAFLDAIAGTGAPPVRVLVNTHHHGDHTHGNHLFGSATIVAHDTTREKIIAIGDVVRGNFPDVEWGDVPTTPPSLTFRDAITVYAGDLRAEVRYVGRPAHTTGDAVVWLPGQGVLFAGDLVFEGGTPFAMTGSVAGSIQVLEEIRAMAPAVIVPGHGRVCGVEAVDTALEYLRLVQDTARRGHAAGLSPLELARSIDLGRYADLRESERLVGNLHRAYAEIDGAAPGSPLPQPAASHDMEAYRGGPLDLRNL
jgi:cyclase